MSLQDNTWYRVTLSIEQLETKVWLNDELMIQAFLPDARIMEGKIGFIARDDQIMADRLTIATPEE